MTMAIQGTGQLVRPFGPSGGIGGTGGAPSPFKAASSVLGMGEREIARAVAGGQSLNDLAAQQGVATSDLKAALVEGLPDEISAVMDVDGIVESMMSHSGPPPALGGASTTAGGFTPPSGIFGGDMTSAQNRTLQGLADLLGTDPDSLKASLSSGQELLALLEERQVSPAALASVVEQSLLYDARV